MRFWMHPGRLTSLLAGLAVWLLFVQVGRAQEVEVPAEQPAAPANPLSDLLKRVFRGGGDVESPTAEDGMPENPEARNSASSRDARLLAQAEQAARSADWQVAVEVLQSILDRPEDSLWKQPDGGATSLQAEAEARIGRLPEPGRALYDSEHGAAAAQLLSEASARDPLGGAAQTASRYFHTAAGKQAAEQVAALLFDRGEYRAAAAWYLRLANDSVAGNDAGWQARATYALLQIGERAQAEPLLQALADAPVRATIAAAGTNDSLAEWLLNRPMHDVGIPVLDDWRTLYGSAAHVGAAAACDPLLLVRWNHPLTARYALLQQLHGLLLDLEDNQRAAIPSVLPIVVGDCVAFRTFRGLAVVDAASGELLWESEPGISAERLLSHGTPNESMDMFSRFSPFDDDGETRFEHDELKSLLFRDAGYGLLSSDGRRVYSIENSVLMPPSEFGYWWGGNSPSSQDPHERDWTSNQIHAYDLRTGERVWEAGGRRMREPFDPELAGVFFFGPPVAEGDELFTIGERDGEISLFCLAPGSGERLWSQPIAPSGATVEQDLVRRLWACVPAIDGGLVICPTNTGSLVAVDRYAHRIAWVHRMGEQPEATAAGSGAAVNQLEELNDRWAVSAPIVVQGAVVYAPAEQPDPTRQEQPRLICLDLQTGAKRWERLKGTDLYVAGAFGGKVVLVGRDAVSAYELSDGASSWTLPIEATDGPPSGRGVAVGSQFLLPLRSGQLWTIDLASGQLTKRARPPGRDDNAPLGNLAIWRGMLLSLGPQGMTGYEPRDELEQEIAARLAADEGDLWAAVKQAEVRAATGDVPAVLALLDGVETSPDSDAALIERRRRLTFEGLTSLAKGDLTGHAAEFERAAGLAAGDNERLAIDQLAVDRHVAAGRWDDACALCEDIAGRYANERMLEEGPVSLRLDVWLGGRLQQIAERAPAEAADSITARISATLETASLELPGAARLERIYGFHPAAEDYLWRLMEDAAARGDFAGAEVRLRRFLESPQREQQAEALARLGQLLVDFRQPADAAAAYARLSAEFGDVSLRSGETGAACAERQFDKGAVDRTLLEPPGVAEWTNDRFSVQHLRVVSDDYSTPSPPVTRRLDALFFRNHAIDFDVQSPVMSIRRRADDSTYWSVPLRAGNSQYHNQSAALIGHGLQFVALQRGMLHAVSPADRKVLWSRPVAEQQSGLFARFIYDDGDAPMLQGPGGFAGRNSLSADAQSPTGMLAVATSRYVACHGRSEFVMLDPLTGDVLWRRRSVSPQTGLFGNSRVLIVVPPDESETYVLNPADGRRLAAPDLPALVKSTLAVTSSGLVGLTRKSRGRSRTAASAQTVIAATDPLTQAVAWSRPFPSRSRMTMIDDRRLLVLDEASGECSLLDFETGGVQPIGNIPASAVQQASEVYAIADAELVYLLVNDARSSNSYIQQPALRASGTILALARDGSGLAWQQSVANQNLLLPQFRESPLLVFLSYDQVHVEDVEIDYANARLLVLDKGDGRKVAEDSRAVPNGNYYRIEVNRPDRCIDILSYNSRVRIQAVRTPEPVE